MYTEEQDKFIFKTYLHTAVEDENEDVQYSLVDTARKFRVRFPNEEFNYQNFTQHVARLVKRFDDTGSVLKGKSTGRPIVLTEETVEDIRARIVTSPRKPLRQLSAQTGLSTSTCHKALRKELKMKAYKISVVQELLPLDYEKRVRYCNWFKQNVNAASLNTTFFTDEAWFHLSGFVNSQNYRVWSSENPHQFRENALHPTKVGVCVAMSRRRIIGPIFFDGTINADRYKDIILEPFINELHDDELQSGWFQQDGATAHTAGRTIQYLREFYDDRIISAGLWPPRSPDLTPLDYFLFGYLKTKIFQNRLHTIEEMKNAITDAIQAIDGTMLESVFDNMLRRVDKCLEYEGGHFQHLL